MWLRFRLQKQVQLPVCTHNDNLSNSETESKHQQFICYALVNTACQCNGTHALGKVHFLTSLTYVNTMFYKTYAREFHYRSCKIDTQIEDLIKIPKCEKFKLKFNWHYIIYESMKNYSNRVYLSMKCLWLFERRTMSSIKTEYKALEFDRIFLTHW